jgi:putative membrane protein
MKLLVWLLRLIVFIGLLGLAIKNDGVIELRFFFDHNFQAPLSLVLLASFAGGAVVGLSAAVATLVRQRIELSRLRRANEAVKS